MPATFTFDGINKIIQLDNTSSFDVGDLYSRWKDWVLTTDNSKFQQAFRFVGGDPTVGGKSLGITYFLTNSWTIQPFSQDHRLQIEGNLFTDSGDSPFITASGSFNVLIESEVSNLTDSEILSNTQQRSLEYDPITINTITGTSGTTYPVGTKSSPVNNIDDAITLTGTYGVFEIQVCNNLTINSGSDISNLILTGKNKNIKLTLNSCPADNTTFKNLIITGNPQ